jgi:hypothetical protein
MRATRLGLERRYAWRRVLPEQADKIVASLLGHNLSIDFEFNPLDPEASNYAIEILLALQMVPGITTHVHHATRPPPASGITLFGVRGAARDIFLAL